MNKNNDFLNENSDSEKLSKYVKKTILCCSPCKTTKIRKSIRQEHESLETLIRAQTVSKSSMSPIFNQKMFPKRSVSSHLCLTGFVFR